jgi:hypothetical protein
MFRDAVDVPGLLRVLVKDDAFPAALVATRVEVDLDEAVDRVHRGSRVGHPRDVVRTAVVLLARPVEADEGLERSACRRWRHLASRFEVRHDAGDRRAVPPADAIHLLAEAPIVVFHQPRVQRVGLFEPFEIGRRHVRVEVVRGGGEDVLAWRRCLARDHRPVRLVQEVACVRLDECLRRGVRTERHARAARDCGADRLEQLLTRDLERDLARREVLVRARVDPEQFGVLRHRVGDRRVETCARLEQRLDRVAHHEGMLVALVVVDVAS